MTEYAFWQFYFVASDGGNVFECVVLSVFVSAISIIERKSTYFDDFSE